MNDYFETKNLIPTGNLYEIKFEEFDNDNLLHLKEIYEKLKLNTWNEAEPYFKEYVRAQKNYTKNTYKITKTELDLLLSEWGFAMEKLNYNIPENLEIV